MASVRRIFGSGQDRQAARVALSDLKDLAPIAAVSVGAAFLLSLWLSFEYDTALVGVCAPLGLVILLISYRALRRVTPDALAFARVDRAVVEVAAAVIGLAAVLGICWGTLVFAMPEAGAAVAVGALAVCSYASAIALFRFPTPLTVGLFFANGPVLVFLMGGSVEGYSALTIALTGTIFMSSVTAAILRRRFDQRRALVDIGANRTTNATAGMTAVLSMTHPRHLAIDLQGRITEISPPLLAALGVARSRVIGTSLRGLLSEGPATAEATMNMFRRRMVAGETFRALPIKLDAGGEIIETTISGLPQPDGATYRLFLPAEDLAHRTEGSGRTTAEASFRELMDRLPIGVVMTGADGRVERLNAMACALLPGDAWAMGASFADLYRAASPSDVLPTNAGPTHKLRYTEDKRTVEERGLPRDGGGHLVILIDRTEDAAKVASLARATADANAARDRAETLTQAKSDLLANMSHELRTPMNGVLGMAEALQATALDDDQADLVGVISRSASALLTIVNDVLDFSKLEAGRMSIAHEPFDPMVSLGDVLTIVEPLAMRKNLRLSHAFPPAAEMTYLGDAVRLRQIVTNLLGNAIKFTDQGDVRLEVTLSPDPSTLIVEVSDTGCGIPEEELSKIFEKFEQTEATAHRIDSTGLGLTISQHLARMMGGEISARSVLGQGSTFRLVLPLTPASEDRRPDPGSADGDEAAPQGRKTSRRARVLVAEDNEINRMVMRAILPPAEFDVVFAENGEAAVARFVEDTFDIVLMDVSMPVLDGYAASQAIRGAGAAGATVPIIGVTGHASADAAARCQAAGMNDVVTKPVGQARLLPLMEKWMVPAAPAEVAKA